MSLTPSDSGSDASDARWRRIEALLVTAVELPPEARADFIARECADDTAMAVELRALLAAHDKAGMLDRPLARWSTLAPSVDGLFFTSGAVVAQRYEILEQIGAGGMGVVYRARDLRLERTVALKFLPPSLSEDDHAKRRFLTEARAAAALEHVNVCTLYEIGETEAGQLFIAMALVEGEPLRRVIERGRLPVADAVDIARQLAGALRAAHARGIVHRDIKPGNVMLGVGGVVKLVDFGIAKLEGSAVTAGGVTPGTAAYMSPEQVRGEEVDHRTDLWALGVVLYEMLAGSRPFGGGNDATVTHAILTREPGRLRSLDPNIPAALDHTVARALAKDREQRFQSADEVLSALARVGEPGVSATVRQPALSRRAITAILGTVAALVIAGTVAWRRVATERARDAIPEIEQLASRGSYVEAHTLAAQAARRLPGDSTLARVMPLITDRLTVESDPAGASVWVRRVLDDGSLAVDSTMVGVTPIRNVELARADYRLDIRKNGFASAARIASSALNRAEASLGVTADVTISVVLQEPTRVPAEMVLVPGSQYALVGSEAPIRDSMEVGDFFIDAYEVTNAQFREFVAAGGYTDPRYWKHPFVLEGQVISWADAMRRLVDRTGLHGPRGWTSQEFPPNEARHPVTGVTWYEASAYAEFAGKRLPTIFEWEKAARDGRFTHFDRIVMPWGLADPTLGVARRANFGSAGTEPVDSHASGISPYGAYNMAGNVEEWVANPSGQQRFATGGAWDDPMYVFANYLAVSGFHASPSLGFRCARDVPGENGKSGNNGQLEIPGDRRTPTYRAVDDATFQLLLRHYAYDRAPLEASVVARDTTRDWMRETTRIAGPWNDPTVVYLYLPLRATAPLQTIAFVPGTNTFFEASPSEEAERIMAPHVKAGRAVFTVLFKGMVGRPWEAGHVAAPTSSVQYRQELVKHATELRRSLDYLETRQDLDLTRLGYVGFSRGSGAWLMFVAVEPRFRSIVFLGGGIDETFLPALPEAKTINFASRIAAPTLLLNGRYDEEHPWISRGLPLWRLLREPKRLMIVDGGHLPRAEERVPAINAWFDETLGVIR